MRSLATHSSTRSCRPARIMRAAWAGACLSAVLLMSGCSELEPIGEPIDGDLQIMVNSLQNALRENERTLSDLRIELDSRRQDLSVAVVARAQLEGRLRDIERRLSEARHIIDLQREELAQRHVEREPVAEGRQRSGDVRQKSVAKAKSKPKAVPVPSQEPLVDDPRTSIPAPLPVPPVLPDAAVPATGETDMGATGAPGVPGVPVPPIQTPQAGPTSMAPAATAAPLASASLLSQQTAQAAVPSLDSSADAGSLLAQVWQRVVVQAGDTLYGLARRYGVSIGALREANGLRHDRIKTGQRILVPHAHETQEASGSLVR